MTRSDYLRIAAALEKARRLGMATPFSESPKTDFGAFLAGVEAAAHCVAEEISVRNPKFDKAMFLANAGLRPV